MSKPNSLTRKQRAELAAKLVAKAAKAARRVARREKLILDHCYVVLRIARTVHRSMTHVDIEDLQQAGYVGLLEAANRYKPSSGVFENYAYFRVRGAMIDAHKRSAYRNDTLFLDSIDAIQEGSGYLPRSISEDKMTPMPDATAARREQARLLAKAVDQLDPDEQRVFVASLQGIALIKTAGECGHTVAWARAKLASARSQLGATVQMWGLGLDKTA